MNATDVVGYSRDCYVLCNNCISDRETDDGEEDIESDSQPIFCANEGWEEMICDFCGETLKNVEGVGA